jgi:hypothetical protein
MKLSASKISLLSLSRGKRGVASAALLHGQRDYQGMLVLKAAGLVEQMFVVGQGETFFITEAGRKALRPDAGETR